MNIRVIGNRTICNNINNDKKEANDQHLKTVRVFKGIFFFHSSSEGDINQPIDINETNEINGYI